MPDAVYILKNHCHQACWHRRTDTCAHAALFVSDLSFACWLHIIALTQAHAWSPSLPHLWNSAVIQWVFLYLFKFVPPKIPLYSVRHCDFMLSHVMNVFTSLMTPLTSPSTPVNNGLPSLCMHAVSASHTSSNWSSSRKECRNPDLITSVSVFVHTHEDVHVYLYEACVFVHLPPFTLFLYRWL